MMPVKIMFQPANGIGLGHISRLASIALAVREQRNDAELPFLVTGGSHSLLESLDLPYLSLPSSVALERACWQLWPAGKRDEIIYKTACAIVEAFSPQLIVFDLIPSNQVLRAAIERQIPIALVVRKSRDMRFYFDSVMHQERHIHLFIFPHETNEITVPSVLRDRARFVGRIVRPAVVSRHARSESGKKVIVITGGGGGHQDTVKFYNQVLAAISASNDPAQIDTHLIAGPLFNEWDQLRLINGASVIPFASDMASRFANADLVICQAGYNTVAELSQLGTRLICIPAPRTLDDQFERATQLASSFPQTRMWTGSDTGELSQLIDEQLRQEGHTNPVSNISSAGAERAAKELINLAASGVGQDQT